MCGCVARASGVLGANARRVGIRCGLRGLASAPLIIPASLTAARHVVLLVVVVVVAAVVIIAELLSDADLCGVLVCGGGVLPADDSPGHPHLCCAHADDVEITATAPFSYDDGTLRVYLRREGRGELLDAFRFKDLDGLERVA